MAPSLAEQSRDSGNCTIPPRDLGDYGDFEILVEVRPVLVLDGQVY